MEHWDPIKLKIVVFFIHEPWLQVPLAVSQKPCTTWTLSLSVIQLQLGTLDTLSLIEKLIREIKSLLLNSIKNANLRICKHEICYGLNSYEILPRIHWKLEVCTIKMILGKAENYQSRLEREQSRRRKK